MATISDLKQRISQMESDELLHKLQHGYFSSDAQPLAIEILREKGIEYQIDPEESSKHIVYRTYAGETSNEVRRRRFRQMAFILSFVFPMIISGIAWLVLIVISDAELSPYFSALLYLGDLVLVWLLYSKCSSYLERYDPSDSVIYPWLFLLGPTVSFLLLLIIYSLALLFE